MKKKSLNFIALVSASFIATSCSIFTEKQFDWMKSTKDNTEINYCLLIGQNEHSDSIERTRYTREALKTRDPSTEINGNANLGTPKVGELELGSGDEAKKFKVTEIEHMEQKSLAGVVWDTITANSSASTWISKHGDKITMFISNNDGMAEGALFASNYINGLPIFGYDANTSTLKFITQGKVMGTVDQNASVQTASAYLLIRNILEDLDANANDVNKTNYNPLNRGFSGLHGKQTDYGIYIDGYNTGGMDMKDGIVDPFDDKDERFIHNMDLSQTDGRHQILSKSIAIDEENVDSFVDETGKVLEPETLAWSDDGYVHKNNYKAPEKRYKVCHVYNNAAEVYLQGTMRRYYQSYNDALGLDVNKIDGDGIDEQKIFTQLEGACASTKFDAFLINMVTTTDGPTFVNTLAKYAGQKEDKPVPTNGWDNWEDRLKTPLIFWNKQPQTVQGEVDTATMNNKFFRYTYFVGVDAQYGGKEQGKMIVNYLERQYLKSLGDKKK